MPLVSFHDLMAEAELGQYAVGYFECWNLESLLAVADAAERAQSPVILGYSGIYLPHPQRRVRDRLAPYAAMGLETCDGLSVPACLLFNESPHRDWVVSALDLGFNLVMFSDHNLPLSTLVEQTQQLVRRAHKVGAAVEGEVEPLPGVAGELCETVSDDALRYSDVDAARTFVLDCGIDALAVNIGQIHLHGRRTVRLDLKRLEALHSAVSLPLVLHGATSVAREDLRAAIALGIRKINVGSLLKQVYFEALRSACAGVGEWSNPYEIIGSGLDKDVLVAGRLAVEETVEELMHVFGSAGRAPVAERMK